MKVNVATDGRGGEPARVALLQFVAETTADEITLAKVKRLVGDDPAGGLASLLRAALPGADDEQD